MGKKTYLPGSQVNQFSKGVLRLTGEISESVKHQEENLIQRR
jgi:hypothetical protein